MCVFMQHSYAYKCNAYKNKSRQLANGGAGDDVHAVVKLAGVVGAKRNHGALSRAGSPLARSICSWLVLGRIFRAERVSRGLTM